jgi:hypothetical protein
VVALQRVLELLGDLAGEIDGTWSATTVSAVQALQRRLGVAPTGELTPALVARARAAAAVVGAEAHARAAAAAEDCAALYQQIAAARQGEVEAARARHPGRPTCLTEEEVGASLLAAARSNFEAAAHWRRAAVVDDPAASRLARAAGAQARARRAALAADPWFRSAAAGHLAAGDRLQGSRALEGAVKAAALAAEAADLGDEPVLADMAKIT